MERKLTILVRMPISGLVDNLLLLLPKIVEFTNSCQEKVPCVQYLYVMRILDENFKCQALWHLETERLQIA